MRRPTDQVFRGLEALAGIVDGWCSESSWNKLPVKLKKKLLAARRWIRGMRRIKDRRALAHAMMEEHKGLYVKPPAYNPDWFGRRGYHLQKDKDQDETHLPRD